MSRFTILVGFLGILKAWSEERSPLYGLRMRPIFRLRLQRSHFRASAPSSPDRQPRLPQPSWVTTKETAAWRFGA